MDDGEIIEMVTKRYMAERDWKRDYEQNKYGDSNSLITPITQKYSCD